MVSEISSEVGAMVYVCREDFDRGALEYGLREVKAGSSQPSTRLEATSGLRGRVAPLIEDLDLTGA